MPVIETIDWGWSGQQFSIDATRIGQGPTVLLLPALSSISTREEMRPLQERLASSYATVSVDWPGFGDRPRPFVDWRPPVYRAFLAHILNAVAPCPLATVATGHAAAYLLQQAEAAPGSAGALCLIAPTWRGPLPTLSGRPPAAFDYLVQLVDLPGIGALAYALNVNPPVVRMMMRGHVYADPAFATPGRLAEKLKVTRAAGARHASVRFVTGALDPAGDRASFLAGARRVSDPVLVLYGADTPRKSRLEMEALAALPNVQSGMLPRGKLAAQEEYPAAVETAIREFLGAGAS